MIRTYQAIDSVTGGLYTWQAATLDYLGTGYPGPNSPTHVLQISPEYWHGDSGAAYVAQWRVVSDVDFAAQDVQTFADGTHTLGGYPLTLVRASGGMAATAIVSDGLKMPATNGVYGTAGYGAGVNWYASLAGVPIGAPLRAAVNLVRFEALNSIIGGGVYCGFTNPAAYSAVPQSMVAYGWTRKPPSTTLSGFNVLRYISPTSPTNTVVGCPVSADRYGLYCPGGVMLGSREQRGIVGVSSDSFDSLGSWPSFGASCLSVISDATIARNMLNPADWCAFLSFGCSNQGADVYAVIGRWRVEAWY
jgi:hypothetical protein